MGGRGGANNNLVAAFLRPLPFKNWPRFGGAFLRRVSGSLTPCQLDLSTIEARQVADFLLGGREEDMARRPLLLLSVLVSLTVAGLVVLLNI
jgi:hypothetical protein